MLANLSQPRGGLLDKLLALQLRSGQSLLTEKLVATGHSVPEALLIGLLDAALPCSTRIGLASLWQAAKVLGQPDNTLRSRYKPCAAQHSNYQRA